MEAAQQGYILGVNPKKLVTQEELDTKRAHLLMESPSRVILLETPASDAKIMEELLGIEEGTLPKFICRFRKGAESCAKCGRHYSILDMAKSGLQVHSKQFLIDTIFGRLGGPVYNDVIQLHSCYNCGEKAGAVMDYMCDMYGCGPDGSPDDDDDNLTS